MADTRVASNGRDRVTPERLNSGAMNCAAAPREGSAKARSPMADAIFWPFVRFGLEAFCRGLDQLHGPIARLPNTVFVLALEVEPINFRFL